MLPQHLTAGDKSKDVQYDNYDIRNMTLENKNMLRPVSSELSK